MNRILVAALALGIASTGFAVVTAQEGTGTTTAPLITEEGVEYWTSQGNVVPVCWETAGYQREKTLVQNAVEGAWEYWANIEITGWADCPTTGNAEHVRMRIAPYGTENSGASGSARLGVDALSSAADDNAGVRFEFRAGQANRGRVEYVGVHEFGHVLGFGHEQDAPDNEGPARCTDTIDPDVTGVSITRYDRNSIMNYCNEDGNMTGRLTDTDIDGVQTVYGARRLSPRAQRNASLRNQSSVLTPDIMAAKTGDQTGFGGRPNTTAAQTSDQTSLVRRHDDLVWQHENGTLHYWPLRNGATGPGVNVRQTGPVGSEWRLAAIGDVDGDGEDDLIWQRTDGTLHYWRIRDGARIEGRNVGGTGPLGREWRLLGAGDLNGDGTDDLIWQSQSLMIHYWPMRAGARLGGHNLWPDPMSDELRYVGAGDTNGDGVDEIVWRGLNGSFYRWEIVDNELLSSATLGGPPTALGSVNALGVGDIDNDGRADIVIQNMQNRRVMYARADRGIIGEFAYIANVGGVGPEWRFRGVGDIGNGETVSTTSPPALVDRPVVRN